MVCTLHKAIFCNQLCIILQPILVGTSKFVPVRAFWHFSTLIWLYSFFIAASVELTPIPWFCASSVRNYSARALPVLWEKTCFGEPFTKLISVSLQIVKEKFAFVSVCVKHRAGYFDVNTWMHLCAPVSQIHYLPQWLHNTCVFSLSHSCDCWPNWLPFNLNIVSSGVIVRKWS